MLTLCSISLFALKVTHFVLFHDVRGCLSGTSFQATISQRLESHPASIETGGLQAMDNCLIFTCTYNLCDCYNLFYTRLFSVSSYVRNSVEIDWRRENNKKKFVCLIWSRRNSKEVVTRKKFYWTFAYMNFCYIFGSWISIASTSHTYQEISCISTCFAFPTQNLMWSKLRNFPPTGWKMHTSCHIYIYNRT